MSCFAFRACFKLTAAAHGFLRVQLAGELSEKLERCAVFHPASNALTRIGAGRGVILENGVDAIRFRASDAVE